MKKSTVKIIRPSESIASLSEYNTRVVSLTSIVDMVLKNNLVHEMVKEALQERNNSVKEFYTES